MGGVVIIPFPVIPRSEAYTQQQPEVVEQMRQARIHMIEYLKAVDAARQVKKEASQ